MKNSPELIQNPEEVIYRSCYAPVDLSEMLDDSTLRAKIRRLPEAQLFFAVKELDDEEIAQLLPQITEEQWKAILDLDSWEKDRLNIDSVLGWERHIVTAEDAVARKVIRATDPELWELAFSKQLEIYRRTEDDEFEREPGDDQTYMITPDSGYLIILPSDPEKARVYRQVILRLFDLDAETTKMLLEESLFRTPSELEEEAFQNRRRRIEDMGFLDYFEAIEIYTPRNVEEELPAKMRKTDPEVMTLPIPVIEQPEGPLLLFQALALIEDPDQMQLLIEELFYVCNKLLSADRISASAPERVKKTIRKAISAMNLGLDCWAQGQTQKATAGVAQHYLLSFFQVGYGKLLDLKKEAVDFEEKSEVDPGSTMEAFIEGLLRKFPILREDTEGKIKGRYFETREDLDHAYAFLETSGGSESSRT